MIPRSHLSPSSFSPSLSPLFSPTLSDRSKVCSCGSFNLCTAQDNHHKGCQTSPALMDFFPLLRILLQQHKTMQSITPQSGSGDKKRLTLYGSRPTLLCSNTLKWPKHCKATSLTFLKQLEHYFLLTPIPLEPLLPHSNHNNSITVLNEKSSDLIAFTPPISSSNVRYQSI